MKTFVYVISGDHGRQKIGSSDDPKQRIRDLQTGSPYPLKFEFIGECENGTGGQIEVEAQFSLSAHKSPGGDEWFRVPSDVAIAAVIGAGHRLGYRVRPVDPDRVASKAYAIGMPLWQKLLMIPIAAVAAWFFIPALLQFDRGEVGGVYLVVMTGLVIAGMYIARFAAIKIVDAFVAFDRAMHPEGR